jgi:hypothetical protein
MGYNVSVQRYDLVTYIGHPTVHQGIDVPYQHGEIWHRLINLSPSHVDRTRFAAKLHALKV